MSTKFKKYPKWILMVIVLGYLVLLIPDRKPEVSSIRPIESKKQPFVWSQDAYWEALEARYRELRKTGCQKTAPAIQSVIARLGDYLKILEGKKLNPEAKVFDEIEQQMFEAGSLVGGCGSHFREYMHAMTDLRTIIKRQSEHWDMNSDTSRITLYRLLYGARAAVEEIILQMPLHAAPPALVVALEEGSQTPSVNIKGVALHSGDILVSRGGAPTSALIARGNDFPGNFSHIALFYVDPNTHEPKTIEAHIERGVTVSSFDEYLRGKKLRIMVLRLRSDLPQLIQDPMLPHKAAEMALKNVMEKHIPYDFEMNYKDPSRLFCSEVASSVYATHGVKLWMGISHISSAGLRKWLAALGVKYFETEEPSDLEYDPQLRVVAEWRDLETLRKDHFDNAVTDVMVEGAEKGDELSYDWYLLPIARVAKAVSVLLNLFGKVGMVPEGMSATTGLRGTFYERQHARIHKQLALRAEQFKTEQGYEPPYWQLVRLAHLAKKEVEGR
jgi:hypothetical protein